MSADAPTSTQTGWVDGPPERKRPWMRLEVVAFLIVPLLVLAAVAGATVWLSERIARANALSQAEQIATRFSRLLLKPPLEGTLAGEPGRRTELDNLVDARLSDGSMSFLIVWSIDGTILYANRADAIGDRHEPSDDLVAAAGGATVAEIDEEPEASYVSTLR